MKHAVLCSALLLTQHISFSGTCCSAARPKKSSLKTKEKQDQSVTCTLTSQNNEIIKTSISWPQHGGHLIVTEDEEEISAKHVIKHNLGAFRNPVPLTPTRGAQFASLKSLVLKNAAQTESDKSERVFEITDDENVIEIINGNDTDNVDNE